MNRLGIEMLTLLGISPVEHVRIAAELDCVSISTGLTGLPLKIFGIETILYPPWSLQTDMDLRRDLKAALADTGVHIALGEGFGIRSNRHVQELAADLDIMVDLGARRINAIGIEYDRGRSLDQFAMLSDMVIDRGMDLTVEFAPPNAISNLADALAVVDHVGQDRVSILFDTMHFFRSGGTISDLRNLDPGIIGYAQLCDVPTISREPAYMEEAMFARCVPGKGELPLAEFVAALPKNVEIGVEVPDLAAFELGITPFTHAARVVAAARAVGA